MADNVDFFSLPMGANPDKDTVVGFDELDRPRYRTAMGTEYTIETQAPQESQYESEPGTFDRVKEVGSDIVTGAIEGTKAALTAPGRAARGESVTYGDAFGTAGIATLGASTVTKPAGALSAGAARTKKKSEINPLFKPLDRPGRNLVTFYSPLLSSLNELQFGKGGKSGQDIMAYLNKRAPNVSRGEVDFSRIDLDPKKKYTKDEVLDNLQYSLEGTRANFIPRDRARWEDTQIPGNYSDKVEDYFEITLDTEDLPKDILTHHDDFTIGHSRATVHRSRKDNGEAYIVLNEIQSDALQNVGKTLKHDEMDPMGHVEDFIDGLDWELDFGVSDKTKSILEFVSEEANRPTFDRKELMEFYRENFGVEPQGRDILVVHKDAIRRSLKETDNEIDLEAIGIDDDIEDLLEGVVTSKDPKRSYEKSDLPIRSNTEYVRNLLIANIARAKEMGIETLVIPNIKELARLRAEDFGGSTEAAERALKPTYVDAVRKAVNTLNNEYGGRIGVGKKGLDYKDLTKPDGIRTTVGTALDISNFEFDPRNQAVRFAEGGQVTSLEDQMGQFEEGGIVDDGMEVEPVTGNEIPPGSLAKEVRDDIPAQLSEGEYVVPADVVRYFGVKFFEDLRDTAKGGLSDMEMDGRIGGTPVDSNGIPQESDELSEEEMRMLEEVLAQDSSPAPAMGMNMGGLATPTFSYQSSSRYPTVGAYGRGSGGASGGMEARKYINPTTGKIRSFQFLNGMPISFIPPEFVPYTPGAEQEAAAQTTQTQTQGTGVAMGNVDDRGQDDGPGTDRQGGGTTSGRDQGPPQYGIGTTASTIAGGVAGLAGFGLMGAAGGARSGKLAGEFNDARNSLVDATLANDTDAIEKAKKDIEKSFDRMNNAARMSVFGEGKSWEDAVKGVENDINDYYTTLEELTPPGMRFDRTSLSYKVDDSSNDVYGDRIGTGDRGTPIYSPNENTVVPVQKPDRDGGSDDGGGNSGSLGDSVAEAFGFDDWGDMFDGGGRGASRDDSDDSDNDSNGPDK